MFREMLALVVAFLLIGATVMPELTGAWFAHAKAGYIVTMLGD